MKLKNCPFCGSSNLYVDDLIYVACFDCSTIGPSKDDKQDAIKAWNTRAGGWISIEDRLPELSDGTFDYFLVGVYDGLMSETQVAVFSEPKGWHSLGRDKKPKKGVTHWRPMPAPPEEDE